MSELKRLQHFATVFRTGSFRLAAEQFGVSQSTMTKSIAHLEQELQTRLFHRTTRRVEPTDIARSLLLKAEEAISSMDNFYAHARQLTCGEMGSLGLGAIALAAETLIPEALTNLQQRYPGIEVEVAVGSSDVYRDLVQGECDAVIGDEANFQASRYARSLRMTGLREEAVVLLHRHQHPHRARPDKLLQQPLAIPSRYYNENRLFQAFAEQGGPAQPHYRLNNLSACVSLIKHTDVVTLAPQSYVSQLLGGDDISVADVGLDITVRFVLVTLAAHSPTPAILALGEALSGNP
ncbi:MAG: LysR family transcriptional regulator [Pseudomonadota bacterium]